ncbi:hypothetical protein BHS07_34695 [Myxococcus xanthus]|nr:hypothetical protein BHS07_34695 [Myxococcus xanthus]
MEVFHQAAQAQFVHETLLHVRRHFPEEVERLGDEEARAWVRHGTLRAESHGLTLESNIRRYVDLMFAFGHDFDMDPTMPWANTILEQPSQMSETARMDWLYETALAQLDEPTNGAR